MPEHPPVSNPDSATITSSSLPAAAPAQIVTMAVASPEPVSATPAAAATMQESAPAPIVAPAMVATVTEETPIAPPAAPEVAAATMAVTTVAMTTETAAAPIQVPATPVAPPAPIVAPVDLGASLEQAGLVLIETSGHNHSAPAYAPESAPKLGRKPRPAPVIASEALQMVETRNE
jgi:ribonuclease E